MEELGHFTCFEPSCQSCFMFILRDKQKTLLGFALRSKVAMHFYGLEGRPQGVFGTMRHDYKIHLEICRGKFTLVAEFVATAICTENALCHMRPTTRRVNKIAKWSKWSSTRSHGESRTIYRARKKGLHVVARNFFLLLLNCSAWPCLAVA